MNKPIPYIELDVWKKAKDLVLKIYNITKDFPKEELYCLINQLQRCAVSIPSNIAEGYGREHINDSLQFFYIARGSLYELETQLFISLDLKYITQTEFDKTIEMILESKKLLNGFINYYKNQKN